MAEVIIPEIPSKRRMVLVRLKYFVELYKVRRVIIMTVV